MWRKEPCQMETAPLPHGKEDEKGHLGKRPHGFQEGKAQSGLEKSCSFRGFSAQPALRLPNTVLIPTLEPLPLTVAVPTQMNLAAVSMSLEMVLF